MGKTKNKVTAVLTEIALRYIGEKPEDSLPKLMKWIDMVDTKNSFLEIRNSIRAILENTESNWYQFILSLWRDLNPEIRKIFFQNLIVNSWLLGRANQQELIKKHQCNLPWAILMDPTSACNLHCRGCWAAEYGNKMNMSYEILDSIINQGKVLGTYMYIYSGGEPLIRKKDIIRLCEAHPDCCFLSFTNGVLIDEEFASEMLRVKNFIPAISIEGMEAETDSRRGSGTYQKVIAAMKILKQKKLLYGISCCYTSENYQSVGSEAFFDSMIDEGAKFAWFFTYIPIGKNAVPSLIATAEQRKFMYYQLRKMRREKPIFTMDFWNDGEFVDGCIAGGRSYLHINANGDIEPCAFIHYSDSNIHSTTLLEAYKNPLFMQYRQNQPFNQNMLRPCPLLDNPEYLRKMVHATKAKSTDLENPEDVDTLTAKCMETSKAWASVAEAIWNAEKP